MRCGQDFDVIGKRNDNHCYNKLWLESNGHCSCNL